MMAYVLIALSGADETHIQKKLESLDPVVDAKVVFGEWDLIVKVQIESTEALGTFVMDHIRKLDGIKMTSTLICATA